MALALMGPGGGISNGKLICQIYQHARNTDGIKVMYCDDKLASATDKIFEITIKKSGTYRITGWVQSVDSAYKANVQCNGTTIFGPFIDSGFDFEKSLNAGDVISIPSQYMNYYSTQSATLIIVSV